MKTIDQLTDELRYAMADEARACVDARQARTRADDARSEWWASGESSEGAGAVDAADRAAARAIEAAERAAARTVRAARELAARKAR